MLSFGIQFVDSNQYSNKCLVFSLDLFLRLLTLSLTSKSEPCTKFARLFFSWRIKREKGVVFGGQTSPGPTAVFSIIYYSQEVLQPKSFFHLQCKENPFDCLPKEAPQQIACILAFFQAWGSVRGISRALPSWLFFWLSQSGDLSKSMPTPGNCLARSGSFWLLNS